MQTDRSKIVLQIFAGLLGSVSLFIPLKSSRGQEVHHAPTMDMCHADRALWDAKMSAPAKDWATSANDVTARELYAWRLELVECGDVDPDGITRYDETVKLIASILEARQAAFIRRHDLTQKLLAEDAAGAR